MARNPVQQHAQTPCMGRLNEGAEFGRRAVTDRGGIKAHRLIAPAAVKGKFGNRHQLDMGETHVGHVIDQVFRQFQIAQHPVARRAPPAAQMHLIDRDRGIDGLARRPACHPVAVLPRRSAQRPYHRGIGGGMFRPKAHRIGLQRQKPAIRAAQLVFVGGPFAQAGDEGFPDPGCPAPPHRVAAAIPDVEIPHHRNAPRVRRPDGEMRAPNPFMRDHMRAQHLPQAAVGALAQQIFVHLAQNRAKAERIVEFPCRTGIGGAQPIGLAAGQAGHEQARHPVHRAGGNRFSCDHLQPFRPRHKGRQHPALAPPVQAQHRKGVAMRPLGQGPRGRRVNQGSLGTFGHAGLPLVQNAGSTDQTSRM